LEHLISIVVVVAVVVVVDAIRCRPKQTDLNGRGSGLGSIALKHGAQDVIVHDHLVPW
jgi:hypothetical protein